MNQLNYEQLYRVHSQQFWMQAPSDQQCWPANSNEQIFSASDSSDFNYSILNASSDDASVLNARNVALRSGTVTHACSDDSNHSISQQGEEDPDNEVFDYASNNELDGPDDDEAKFIAGKHKKRTVQQLKKFLLR